MSRLHAWRTNGWRSLCALIALCAILTKAAIPAGYMVEARAGDLGIPLVICTAQGAVTLDAAAPSGHEAPGKPGPADGLCAFAGVSPAALGPAAASLLPVAYADWTPSKPLLPADLAPGRGLAAPPPLPARGPPSLRL